MCSRIHCVTRLAAVPISKALTRVPMPTPANAAQSLVEPLVLGGVKGIWNFAAVDVTAPPEIVVNNVHLTDSLMMLTFRMHEKVVLEEHKSWVSSEE